MENLKNTKAIVTLVYAVLYAGAMLWISYLIQDHPNRQTVLLILICLSVVPLGFFDKVNKQAKTCKDGEQG